MKKSFFKLAKRASQLSDHKKHQIGSVLVRKNRVISIACNKLKTHPKSKHQFSSSHAEFRTLLGLTKEETKGCSVYVYRELKNGRLAPSRPCESCMEIIREMEVDKIHYTVYNGFVTEKI